MTRGTLSIANETHWQSRDILAMIRAALRAAGSDLKRHRHVHVQFGESASATFQVDERDYGVGTITIELPKRGRHDNSHPLIQLAQAALDVEGPILPLGQTYTLARGLALALCKSAPAAKRNYIRRRDRIRETPRGQRPHFLGGNFAIRKYAKRKKQRDNRTFTEKVEDDIERAEERVEKWEAEVEHAVGHLERAQKDLKKHQRRLREALRRRGEEG